MNESKIAANALRPGHVLRGGENSYEVVSVLGAGGFGITYKVRRRADGAILAMKEYFPDQLCERADDHTMAYLKSNAGAIETGLKDFTTEARRLDRHNISHPNIVVVNDVFSANNTAYYTMEYVEGHNLRQYIDAAKAPMTPEQALSVMHPVLQAVALIHKNRITHLDIKHENILLTRQDDGSLRPVLIDFGQSKHYDSKGHATSHLTNAGCSEGFAPPEQYMGLVDFTPQADVYALGATLLYLLTSKQPPRSTDISPDAVRELLGTDIPSDITTAIIMAMNPAKKDRTQSVKLFAKDLGIDLDDSADADASSTRLLDIEDKKPVKTHGSRSKWWLAAAAAVVAIAVGSAIWLGNWKPEADPAEPIPPAEEINAPEPVAKESAEDPIAHGAPQHEETAKAEDPQKADDPKKSEDLKKPEESKKAEEAKKPSEEPKKPVESNDELFARATTLADYKALADKGYAKAYAPLAQKYLASRNYDAANTYARKAVASGSNTSAANNVINQLDVLGYYDGTEKGK